MLAVLLAIFVVLIAIFAMLVVILAVLEAMFAVFVVTDAGNVEMVEELTPPIVFTVGASAVPPKSFVNLIFPFTLAVASGVAEPPTMEDTNSVVAICVVLVPGAAVGAVGVPVKLGEAIVARKAMSAIFVVMLAVFDVTLVSNAAMLFAFVVILAVLDAMFVALVVIFVLFVAMSAIFVVILAVLDVTLVSNATMLFAFAVILTVLDAILVSFVVTLVGKFEIVDELTPPTELIVVGKVPVPLPVTSPVNVIN